MKKVYVIAFLFSFSISLLSLGCGKGGPGGEGGAGGGYQPVTLSTLFDVSGAKAILTASSATATSAGASAVKAMQATNITELLKLTSAGSVESIITSILEKHNHPPIAIIENAPDGSVFIGFQWGVWISDGATNESTGRQVAFFRIAPDGTTTIVDSDTYGIGTWYGGSGNGELPVKQVQFVGSATSYDIYYIGKTANGNSVLKKKTANGTITQIGSSRYEVRDFVALPNGLVLFHGSNVGNWNIEWLYVYNSSTNSSKRVFYNDGSYWLRSYYYYTCNNTNYVVLIGDNLTIYDEKDKSGKYSGIVRVTLDSTGNKIAVTALYDDYNMYSDSDAQNTIGQQLIWGYWDPAEMTNKKFFARDDMNRLIVPLSFEARVSNEAIVAFIRQKYQTREVDTLGSLTFEAITTTESWDENAVANTINNLIASHITGETWSSWKKRNDLIGVRFANAKQLVFDSSTNKLYAIISLDQWGSGTARGEKLFQILDATGNTNIVAFPQDTVDEYNSMSKVRIYDKYAVYLSNKGGNFRILRSNLTSPSSLPANIIPSTLSESDIEIFSFNYDSVKSILYYDVYNRTTNTSYIAEQAITSQTMTAQISAEGYTITDVVPFTATQ